MNNSTPRYCFARDAKHWRAYDNRDLKFVATAPFRTRKADARNDAKKLNESSDITSHPA